MMNQKGFSPSFFSEEVCFSDERQGALRKMDHMASYSGLKSDGLEGIASPPLGNRVPLNSQMANDFPPDYYVNRGHNMNILLRKSVIGAERAVSRSLPSAVDHDIGARNNLKTDSASYLFGDDKVNLMGSQYENGLFSSSLSDLFTQNLKLAPDNVGHAHSVAANGAVTSLYEDDVAPESLEELEAKTIGNLLPDDDDLLSGVTDGFDNIVRPNNGEDAEDLDLFSSVGGLELGESAFCALNRSDITGSHVNLERVQPGGSKRLQQPFSSKLEQEESGRVWYQHNSPSTNMAAGFPGSLSYGDITHTDNANTLGQLSTTGGPLTPVLDNILHPAVSSAISNSLPSLVRYDPANRSNITDSGHLRQNHLKFELQGPTNLQPHSFPEFHDGLTNGHHFGSPNTTSSNMSPRIREMIDTQQFHRVDSNGQPIELTEVFCCSGNGCCHTPGRHYTWGNSHHSKPQAAMWPNSPSFVNGIGAAHPQPLHAVPRAHSSLLNALMPLNSHHVGSAPSIDPSLWDRRHTYAGESPDTSMFHPGSLGNMRISGNSPHPLDFVPHNMYPCPRVNCMDVPIPTKSSGLNPHQPRCMVFPARGQMHPMMSSFETPNERTRNHRNDCSSSPADNKKQFELDIERIARGEDKRTTLMIKNIPNKYTSKMLLAAIDEQHKGTYDFIYLPIDFKNKCNVGYAFINMTDPTLIVPLYWTFNGKKWEKFNSEKMASLAYARIQGKAALIAHFQNSSLMNEDKRCRPILFHTDGPNAGDQIPFPAGTNIRPRGGKIRGSSYDETNQATPAHWQTGEDHSSSSSGKDSD